VNQQSSLDKSRKIDINMPITTDFEVFSSKYHNRPIYVDDPMDLPESACIIENLNNEYDTLYDEKQEVESKYNDMYDKYLNMYKLKHNIKYSVFILAMMGNLATLQGMEEDMWEYRVKDTVTNLNIESREIVEEDPETLHELQNYIINKFTK